jgi:mutator protein MutT
MINEELKYANIPIAVFVMLKRDNNLFLIKRLNTKKHDGLWSLPAGRVEDGERCTIAAIREVKEEVGIIINKENFSKPLIMYNHDQEGERIHFFFVCEIWNGEPCNTEPDKCSDAKWFPINNLPIDIIPYVKMAINAIVNGERYIEYGFTE